jgi:hypothetical protein
MVRRCVSSFLLAVACTLAAEADPRAIVRRSVEAFDGPNARLAQSYTFLERVEVRRLNDDGGVKSQSSRTYDVTPVEGSPYRRLVAEDDQPLSPPDERFQQQALMDNIQARRKETPEQRAKRLAEFEKQRTKYREAILEIPDAFQFRLLREDRMAGHPVWVIEGTPRPGYKPRSRYARLFPYLKGLLWINQSDYHWIRTEAELVENFNFGWILVRIHKGARVVLEQTRVNDEVWLPLRIWFTASARVGLIKRYYQQQENTYSRFRKFHVESRVASTDPLP